MLRKKRLLPGESGASRQQQGSTRQPTLSMRTSRRRSPSVVMCGSIHMAALLLNTLIGNAVLPLDSSTTRKAHREVCVATHIRAPVDKAPPHESASTVARGACWCAYRRPWWVEAA